VSAVVVIEAAGVAVPLPLVLQKALLPQVPLAVPKPLVPLWLSQ